MHTPISRYLFSRLYQIYLFSILVTHPLSAMAQEVGPGDSCTSTQSGRYMLSGGPENSGEGYLIACDGTVWRKIFTFNSGGTFRPSFVNEGDCEDGSHLLFHAASGGIVCGVEPSTPEPALCAPEDLVWTTHPAPNGNDFSHIAYGNNTFVAVSRYGTGNRVMTSSDGVSWGALDVSVRGPIAFGNGRFVMLTGWEVSYSVDGENWTTANSGVNENWESVTYGPNGFVAVSGGGTSIVARSADGISWTSSNVEADAPGGRWTDVIYGGDRYVATCGWCQDGNGTGIMSSTDGVNWTAHQTGGCGSWSVAFGDGQYVGGACPGNPFVHSADGINWTTGGWSGEQPSLSNVVHADGIGFVGTGDNGDIYTSANGMNWSRRNRLPGIPWVSYPHSLAYGNGIFVSPAGDGLVMRGVCPE